MKGIFAICVLVHHLYQNTGILSNTFLGTLLILLGSISVAVFFFLSGSGLAISYKKKGLEYVKTFPLKRILPFYVIMVIFIILYTLLEIVLGKTIDWETFGLSFIFGKTIIGQGWYLQVQLWLYILFWVIYRFIKNNKFRLATIGVLLVAYTIISWRLQRPSFRYATVFTFFTGLVYGEFKERIDDFLCKNINWWLSFCFVFIAFCLSVLIVYKIYLVGVVLASNLFVFLVVILTCRLKVNFWITRMLAKISLGIYLVHGFFILGFHSRIVNIINPYLYCLAVTACTIILAICIQPLFELIYSIFNKIGKNKSEQNSNIIN